MTKLLVSVRNASEAQAALEAGAHLIDVKEPTRGSLGAADIDVIGEVAARVAGRAPVSAALGELSHLETAPAMPPGVCWVKIGLAGCGLVAGWPHRWESIGRSLRQVGALNLVAVAYADWEGAQAPPPGEVVRCGAEMGCQALLVDTFDKSGPSVFEVMPRNQLEAVFDVARQRGLTTVLAGKISLEAAGRLGSLPVDYLAVRSAVCRGGRNGVVDGHLVRQLLCRLAQTVGLAVAEIPASY